MFLFKQRYFQKKIFNYFAKFYSNNTTFFFFLKYGSLRQGTCYDNVESFKIWS